MYPGYEWGKLVGEIHHHPFASLHIPGFNGSVFSVNIGLPPSPAFYALDTSDEQARSASIWLAAYDLSQGMTTIQVTLETKK